MARSHAGMTLIETLVGLAILGFIVAALLGALATGARATITADEQAKIGRAHV